MSLSKVDPAMTQPPARSAFLAVMEARGYVHQLTNREGLDEAALAGTLAGYIGFDMTAKSLHVGSLLPIMALRRMQQNGVRPIVLLGGATTKIGDPSDKDIQRPLLGDAEIAANKASIRRVFERFLTFGNGPTDALFVDNSDWLEAIGFIDFLRRFGPHFTINRMLTFDSVRRRLDREQPLTFLEFNYMLMQAVDFLELSRRESCFFQAGGSDQWGNIVNGVELIRRVDGKEAFGLTIPLLTTSTGAKMGKTAQGAVWLNADLLSPYDYWQYWRNLEDASVGKCLNLFTDLPSEESARLAALEGQEINDAKLALADATTALLHGASAAREARETASAAFGRGETAAGLPELLLDSEELGTGIAFATALERLGFVASRSEGRRHILAKAVRLGEHVVEDPAATLTMADFAGDEVLRLSLGKKKHAILRRMM